MALTGPQAEITIGTPKYHGRTTVHGYSRDWRPDAEWWARHCEYIEPLEAFGPTARLTLQPMTLTDWAVDTSWNNAWKEVKCSGNPATTWLEYGDGKVYDPIGPPALDGEDYTGKIVSVAEMAPRLLLSFWRYPAPEGQLIETVVAVGFSAEWDNDGNTETGRMAILFPTPTAQNMNALFSRPFISFHPGPDDWDLKTEGQILHQFTTGGEGSNEVALEQWLIEYEPASGGGGHILLRNLKDPTSWQYYYSQNISLVTGHTGITVKGSVHYVNVTPLVYGDNAGTCGPPSRRARALPTMEAGITDTWEATATWGAVTTEADNWTVSVAKDSDDSAAYYRPKVTFTRTAAAGSVHRPLLWLAWQEHAPTIGDADTTTAPVAGSLLALDYTLRDNWRGASGSAEFLIGDTMIGDSWRRGSYVAVSMGQQVGCSPADASAQIAEAYIDVDGITRTRDGADTMGLYQVGLRIADWVQVRVAKTSIINMRQAGGQEAGEWFRSCWARLGLPNSMVDVDAALESEVIPTGDPLPSKPSFPAEDGTAWTQHFDDVCNALGWRWGIDKDGDGKAFLDAGPPGWVAEGTPDFILDETSADATSLVTLAEHSTQSAEYANAVKALSSGAVNKEGYYLENEVYRAVNLAHDYWSFVTADSGQDVLTLAEAAFQEKYRRGAVLRVITPLHRWLRPDMFLRVDACAGLAISEGSIWRAIQVRHQVSMMRHETESLWIEVPEGALGLTVTQGLFGDRNANQDLDAVATLGALGEYEGITGLPAVGTQGAFDDDGASDDVNDQATFGYLED